MIAALQKLFIDIIFFLLTSLSQRDCFIFLRIKSLLFYLCINYQGRHYYNNYYQKHLLFLSTYVKKFSFFI